MKRLFSLVLAIVITLCFTIGVFAQMPAEEQAPAAAAPEMKAPEPAKEAAEQAAPAKKAAKKHHKHKKQVKKAKAKGAAEETATAPAAQ